MRDKADIDSAEAGLADRDFFGRVQQEYGDTSFNDMRQYLESSLNGLLPYLEVPQARPGAR